MGGKMQPRIVWDPPSHLMDELLGALYDELPVSIRPNRDVLMASELLMEVVEYLILIKKSMPSNVTNMTLTNGLEAKSLRIDPPYPQILPKPFIASSVLNNGPYIANNSTQPQNCALPVGARLINKGGPYIILPKPSADNSGSTGQQPIIHMNPGAKIPYTVVDSSTSRVHALTPTSSKPVPPKPPQIINTGPKKPIISLLRRSETPTEEKTDDATNIQNPDQQTVTVEINSQTKERTFSDTLHSSRTPSPTLQIVTEENNGIGKKTKDHGLICPQFCNCPLNQDNVPLKDDYKRKVFDLLRKGMSPKLASEPSKVLTKPAVQDAVLNAVVESLSRREMHRFLQLVTAEHKVDRSSEGWCIMFKSDPSKQSFINSGLIRIAGTTLSLHQILFKLFRADSSSLPLSQILVVSRKECKASKSSSGGSHTYCINPWHFERSDPAILTFAANPEHKCETRLRLDGHKGYFACPICQQNRKSFYQKSDFDVLTISPVVESRRNSSDLAIADQTPVEVTVKAEVIIPTDESNVDEDKSGSIDELDKEFEQQLGDFEREVLGESKIKEEPVEQAEEEVNEEKDDEHQDMDEQKEQDGGDPDFAVNELVIDIGEEPNYDALPGMKRKRETLQRCWKCMQWWKASDLKTHNCLPRLLNGSLFCCQFCGACSDDVPFIKDHVSKCRRLGLIAIPELVQLKLPGVGNMHDSKSRSKRAKKSDSSDVSTKCHECNITFADNSELVLHTEKSKCKSIQCAMCNKFFANTRTHQKHDCQLDNSESGEFDGVIIIKGNSSVQENRNLVKCTDCKMVLHSQEFLERHLEALSSCVLCNQTFKNLCKLLSHDCCMM